MEQIRAVRRIHFCSGHRLKDHEGLCANLHGHNYVGFFYAVGSKLDTLGRVIDFSELKNRIGGWIEKNWDHTMIVYAEDSEMLTAFKHLPQVKPIFLLPMNPTVENMARYLLNTVCPEALQGTGIVIDRVKLWETQNCFAEVWRDSQA